ncbi:MAG: 5-methyltetrahydropteroyltriglutamate--homocysteine S-methyltransferase [Burkholderiales bacterium]
MTAPPFRAEHIGSLLRPEGLVEGREDQAIARVIRWQEDLGLEVVTDGEFRRESWRLGFIAKVAGFARVDAVGDVDLQRDDAGNVARIGSAPLAVAKLRRTAPIVADEVEFSLSRTTRTVKATLPAPSYLHYPRGRACVDPRVYPDLEEFFDDVVRIYTEELHALAAAGGSYVQLDEVAQPLLCDDGLRAAVRARGDDPDALIDLYIDLINRIARSRPQGMTLGVHMCRGNALGRWMASGSYERIAERTFSTLEADVYFLEYDSARAGGFEPLRFMPPGKRVVLGLVSTKHPALESKDALKKRIQEAARFVPMEDLSISPQCGFASHRRGSGLAFADQEAKLRLVVQTARDVWGRA